MPVVMMSGHGTIETAVDATKIGAFDFLEKPIGLLEAAVDDRARAQDAPPSQEPRRVSLAALGSERRRCARPSARSSSCSRRAAPILILGEPGTGHDIAARALQTPDAPWVALANGARLTANPLALLEEARDGTLYCAEIGQYSKAEQKGLAFLLPKLDKHNVTLVCTSSEPLGNLAAEGKFDAGAARAAVVGRGDAAAAAHAARGHPAADRALLARGEQGRRAAAAARRRCRRPRSTALSNAYWPGNLDHLAGVVQNLVLLRGEITAEHVKRLLGEAAAPNPSLAPEITARFFELPLREAREAFERIYFEQLLGREQSNMSKVAEKAGLERTHLYRKLKQLNIRFSRRTDETPRSA